MYLAASSPVARDHFLMGCMVELIIKESALGGEHHSPFALCTCSRYQPRHALLVIYQVCDRVFHHQMKHREES